MKLATVVATLNAAVLAQEEASCPYLDAEYAASKKEFASKTLELCGESIKLSECLDGAFDGSTGRAAHILAKDALGREINMKIFSDDSNNRTATIIVPAGCEESQEECLKQYLCSAPAPATTFKAPQKFNPFAKRGIVYTEEEKQALAEHRKTFEAESAIETPHRPVFSGAPSADIAYLKKWFENNFMNVNKPPTDSRGYLKADAKAVSLIKTYLPADYDPRVSSRDELGLQNVNACFKSETLMDQGNCGSCWAFMAAAEISHAACVLNINENGTAPAYMTSPQGGVYTASAQGVMDCFTGNGGDDPCEGGPMTGYSPKLSTNQDYEYRRKCEGYNTDPAWIQQLSARDLKAYCALEDGLNGTERACSCDMHTSSSNKKVEKCEMSSSQTHADSFSSYGSEVVTMVTSKRDDFYAYFKGLMYFKGAARVCMRAHDGFISHFNDNVSDAVHGIYATPASYPPSSWKGKHNYHAVNAIGWGTDEDGKLYWIIQNSWGANWGDRGTFKAYADDPIFTECDDYGYIWTSRVKRASPTARTSTGTTMPVPKTLTTPLSKATDVTVDIAPVVQIADRGSKLIWFIDCPNSEKACGKTECHNEDEQNDDGTCRVYREQDSRAAVGYVGNMKYATARRRNTAFSVPASLVTSYGGFSILLGNRQGHRVRHALVLPPGAVNNSRAVAQSTERLFKMGVLPSADVFNAAKVCFIKKASTRKEAMALPRVEELCEFFYPKGEEKSVLKATNFISAEAEERI